MLANNDWALVQRHPSFRRIPQDNPLCCNTKLTYTTKSSELAPTFEDYIKVSDINLVNQGESKTSPIVQPFINKSTTASENVNSVQESSIQSDSLEKGIDEDVEIDIDIEPDEELGEEPFDFSKDRFTLYELLKLKDTEIPFLVENLIPERAITFLAGDSDVGKSVFYHQLANDIIQGKSEFLGLKLNFKHKRVLIINSEDNPRAILVRIKKQLQGKILTKEVALRLNILTISENSVNRVTEILEEDPHDLIIVDAFGDVYGEDMNNSGPIRTFLNMYETITKKYNCSVLFVDHIGKGKEGLSVNKSHLLGSVGKHGKARSLLMLSKFPSKPNIKALKIAKGNYVSEEIKNSELLLEFDPVTLLHKAVVDESHKEELQMQTQQSRSVPSKKKRTLDPIKIAEAKKLRMEGLTYKEVGEKLNVDKSTAYRYCISDEPLYSADRVMEKKKSKGV